MLGESKLLAAAKSFRALFFQAIETDNSQARGLLSLLSMEVPSSSDTEDYNWIGQVPNMEEWIGDRAIKQLAAYDFAIKNKDWANGIEVLKNTIMDDKLGIIRPRIQTLAEAYWRNRWSLILALLTAGKTGLCYDGKYFIAANHVDGDSGAQSNTETDLLDADSYAEARYTMAGLKDDRGNYLGITPTHLLVCPALEQTGLEIVNAATKSSGATNVWDGSVKLVVIPGLDGGGMTSLKAWALADLSKTVKPFIDQMREPVQFAALESPTDENVFTRNTFKYGANYRGNAGYGLWQLIRVSDGSGS